jgi:hypothetical protein
MPSGQQAKDDRNRARSQLKRPLAQLRTMQTQQRFDCGTKSVRDRAPAERRPPGSRHPGVESRDGDQPSPVTELV